MMKLLFSAVLGICVLFCAIVLGADAPAAPRAGKLHVGWSHRDITPNQPVNLAGQFHARVTKVVDSPVTLTALAIETRDGDQSLDQAILISCDLVLIPDTLQARLRKLLDGKLKGFDLRKLMLNATHTHSAPDVGAWPYQIPPECMK